MQRLSLSLVLTCIVSVNASANDITSGEELLISSEASQTLQLIAQKTVNQLLTVDHSEMQDKFEF